LCLEVVYLAQVGLQGVSGSDFSFTTEGESSGTRRTGTERSGESKRSRDYKGKGKAKIQQLEADLKAEGRRPEVDGNGHS
jgi:hypothetical protein